MARTFPVRQPKQRTILMAQLPEGLVDELTRYGVRFLTDTFHVDIGTFFLTAARTVVVSHEICRDSKQIMTPVILSHRSFGARCQKAHIRLLHQLVGYFRSANRTANVAPQ